MMKDGGRNGLYDYGGGGEGKTKQPVEEEEEEGEEESVKSSICCLQGCLAATAVGFSFFVALPTGILLVVYASNKNDVPLLSVGGVLVSLPLIMLIVVIVLCFNQRRLKRLGKNRITSAKKRGSADGSVSLSSSSTTTVTTETAETVAVAVPETAGDKTGEGGEDTCAASVVSDKERY